MIKNGLHIIFLVMFCAFSLAQKPIRYTTKQGLPSNHIYDLQEDADGFMWFATNRGLVKFDGETFRTFTIKDGLPNNDTWLLEKDHKDRLWFFSKSKYQGYIVNDSIYKFATEENKVTTPRFIFKSDTDFWFLSTTGLFHLKDDILKKDFIDNTQDYNRNLANVAKNNNFIVRSNYPIPIPNKKEFVYILQNKLLFFDKNFKKIIEREIKLSKNNNNIENIGLLANNIAFYALDRGVLFINTKTSESTFFSFKKIININSVKYFRAFGTKNEIQISVPGNLLIFDYDLNFKKSYVFPKELSKTSYKDSKGNIWLIDLANGISLIKHTQNNATYFFKNKKVQRINKIDDVLYAGINDVGFYKKEVNSKNFQLIASLTKQNGEIYQIEKDSLNQKLFISSGGSFVFSNNNNFQIILETNLDISFGLMASFKNRILLKDTNFFVAGTSLVKTDENFNNTTFVCSKDALLTSTIFKEKLFYGGADGLYTLKNDSLIKPKLDNQLLNVSVTSFLSTKNNLLVGTDGRGVYLYDENKVTYLKNTDGFSIQKIIIKDNNLWLATNNGVHKVTLNSNDLEKSKITNSFYEADGLLQNNTNDIYIEKDTLYAASDVGLAKLTINNTIYQRKPKLYFKTKNDTLSFKGDKRDNISITFGLQDYVNQDYTKYEYRLLASQKKWTSTQTKTVNFSNLSPDLYTLEIKATDQHFNQTIKKQYLRIIPFWYETKIALVGFIFLFLLLLYVVFYFVKKRIERKAADKTEQEKRIAGLELQALRSQMNPHFVHNSLNAIQYFIQRNEVELSENYLSKFLF